MRKAIFLFLAAAAVAAGCGRTPAEPAGRAQPGATIHADDSPAADSGTARGGNLMGSGH